MHSLNAQRITHYRIRTLLDDFLYLTHHKQVVSMARPHQPVALPRIETDLFVCRLNVFFGENEKRRWTVFRKKIYN